MSQLSVCCGDHRPYVILSRDKKSLRDEGPLSPGSTSWDVMSEASAGLVLRASPQWEPISHHTQGHPQWPLLWLKFLL